jgi:hypothetical protein
MTNDLLLQKMTDKRQTHPLVREGVPQRQNRDCQTVINIWSWAPDGALHKDWLTEWLTVSYNVTLNFTFAPAVQFSWRQVIVDQNWVSLRQSWNKGSAEDLLLVIVIYCDYEWLYKSN